MLADALHYARTNGATHVIDFATLTGAMSIALGDLYAGWFANDDELREAGRRRRADERRARVARSRSILATAATSTPTSPT